MERREAQLIYLNKKEKSIVNMMAMRKGMKCSAFIRHLIMGAYDIYVKGGENENDTKGSKNKHNGA